jgi:hypothetical protein
MACSICHDDDNQGKLCTLGCSHAFHLYCVSEWLLRQEKSSCPMCRAAVEPDRLSSMREERVRDEAYFIAERSGFTRPADDCWHEAERTLARPQPVAVPGAAHGGPPPAQIMRVRDAWVLDNMSLHVGTTSPGSLFFFSAVNTNTVTVRGSARGGLMSGT